MFVQESLVDGKGDRVDLLGFRRQAEKRLKKQFQRYGPDEILPHWLKLNPREDITTLVSRSCDKIAAQLFCKNGCFSREDLVKLVWPHASSVEIETMRTWFETVSEATEDAMKVRAKTPPLLDPREYEDLCTVFKHLDVGKLGELTFDQLVNQGLIYKDDVEEARRLWDTDGNGVLDIVEFCQMMCPSGFRASRQSTIGTLKDGTRVALDNNCGSWRLLDNREQYNRSDC
jgi:Ca2+-binding EF-hand superfamily protein